MLGQVELLAEMYTRRLDAKSGKERTSRENALIGIEGFKSVQFP